MKKKLVMSTTVPETLATILKGVPRYLSQFFDVKLVTSAGPDVARVEAGEEIPIDLIQMSRRITPAADLEALFRLRAYFARERPDIVHGYTQKAGLLCMMAAAAAGVPHRVVTILGMPLMGARAVTQAILSVTERATYLCATHIICTGPGLRDYVRRHLTHKPVHVIGDGALGVDMALFRNDFDADAKRRIRAELKLSPNDFVVAYAGRILGEKGIVELVDAVTDLHPQYPTLRLLLIGAYDETREVFPQRTRTLIDTHPAIRSQGWVWDVRPSLAVADAFALPSYREGMNTGLIEACAFELPCIATDIVGCREIISDGVNGLLVPPRSSEALSRAIRTLMEDAVTYRALKAKARASVETKFSQGLFREGLRDEYLNLLGELPGGRATSNRPF